MALCPFAKHELIPPGDNDPPIKARVAIWHVAVSMLTSLFRYFNGPSGGIESHFYINWRGRLIQYRDTAYQADANYNANDFAVSVETAGWAAGKWNRAQRKTMQRLALWLNEAEGIPLAKCETWDGSGHGYHTQFGAPGPWTPVSKSCPGPERIKQFNDWFVPWLTSQARTAPKPSGVTTEEDDMPYTDWPKKDREALARDVAEALLDLPVNEHDPKGEERFRGVTVRALLKQLVVANDAKVQRRAK